MCGLLGWVGNHDADDSIRFETALDTLAHRGPDDRGIFDSTDLILGFRRLSILDLSAAGHQPMVDPVSGAVLVFNGEIYNFLELRVELKSLGYRFASNSDTEVLLYALIEWGEQALSRLNGMWSLAFWRPRDKTLILSRDRFGVKPLYYLIGKRGLAFASEPKALLKLFPEYRHVSEQTLLNFLINNSLYAGGGESFYQGIQVFPPAHYASYRPGSANVELSRFWDYPEEAGIILEPEAALDQFESLFDDAVRIRLRSDVPVGITLSGGLDSTGVVTAASAHAETPPTCFTSVFSSGEVGELPWAKIASEAIAAPLIPVTATQQDWLPTMGKISWHMDGPGYSPAVYPLWQLMKCAREKNIPVLLEGQGADEALAGYPQYAVLELLSYLFGAYAEKRNVRGISSRLTSLKRTFSMRWAMAWMIRELFPPLHKIHRKRVGFESILRKDISPEALPEMHVGKRDFSVRNRLIDDHKNSILPGLLHYGDVISMAHSIETRNPFLDYRLVEWMFGLQSKMLFNQRETKWVLREYLRRHNQVSIGNRPDKRGYPTPIGSWLASEQGSEVESLLTDKNSYLHQWCDPVKIKRLIEQNRQGAISSEHHLYKLLSTQLWLDACIAGEAS